MSDITPTASPPAASQTGDALARLVVPAIAVVAAIQLGTALWMVVDPRGFFEQVGPFGLYNGHYVRDAAAFQGGLGLALAAGHEVIGTTRSEARAEALRAAGATPVVCDLLEPGRAHALVADHAPEVVIDQLTSLPDDFDPRRKDLFDANDRTRREASGALIAAAAEHGVRRYLLQSIAFLYAPQGGALKDEDAPTWQDAPEPFVRAVRIVTANEQAVLEAPFEGLVLRYGFFYGPGTWYESTGSTTREVRRRRFPVIGGGDGVLSLVHVADAAAATVAAVERGASGIYNVVDDEPATTHEFLPALAGILGAKPPRRVPAWLARMLAGPYPVAVATQMRGASNAKAKRELGWTPLLPSWREGLRNFRDGDPAAPSAGVQR